MRAGAAAPGRADAERAAAVLAEAGAGASAPSSSIGRRVVSPESTSELIPGNAQSRLPFSPHSGHPPTQTGSSPTWGTPSDPAGG